ncbi:patatin-like serine protein [Colletotrichum scovillei]|uniref:Patatin-like serine protein n=1 Tax=Colletotrichum scovillei TaxID=1209932 RepID=A0A9P7RGW5_9PEZI|nr:patatin-like serine protein [Colletotrichum scovillei]KAG7075882.1 patatin-like serine protein [Colletotrichum scovillei]
MAETAHQNQPVACRECRVPNERLFTCIQCNNLSFCDLCWSRWELHKPGAVGWGGRPHEKLNPQVVQRLRDILEPTQTVAEHELELKSEEDTTWFGVGRDSSNRPILQDYGRFAALMINNQTAGHGDRFPQIVSFIGQTGAGKSTLIKMLINRLDKIDRETRYPSPVTSSHNDRVPTTGNVHLYADPMSYDTQEPLLYADCEGLDGGEAVPAALRHRLKGKEEAALGGVLNDATNAMSKTGLGRPRKPSNASQSPASIGTCSRKKFKSFPFASERGLSWAVTPKTEKREYAVTQLYPRILYTFSDVVVFVLRNPRAFESTVLDKLLEWGAASIDKSLNQPVLPHAIIVLNATDKVSDDEWDIKTATSRLLNDIKDAISHEPRFQDQARMWQKIGRTISTTKDLLDCYYASISVIRVPSGGRYMLMDDQAEKLFELIKEKCRESLLNKRRIRMLATADKLQTYLRAACDQFSRYLDHPFDFVKEALKQNPIPQDFSGNILNLAIAISKISTTEQGTDWIFEKMVPMISSCIMLDSVRQNFMGTPVQLLEDAYVKFCKLALREFTDFYAPCSFTHPKNANMKCCNFKIGHDKGHQNENGRIFAAGDYQSDLDLQAFSQSWIYQIRTHLAELQDREQSGEKIATDLHRDQLTEFCQSLDSMTEFVSHSTCFSCLRALPEHPLPCGHVLCSPCVQSYGVTVDTKVEMTKCPFHQVEKMWKPAWTVVLKPQFVGARILCLDGGGSEPGNTGGIIALGLGVRNWSVEECTKTFKNICADAFRPRELSGFGLGLVNKIVTINHGSMYKTKPFEALLQERFQDRPLFGKVSSHSQSEMLTKVAVTSTTSIDQRPIILTNYNRPNVVGHEVPYQLLRPNQPSQEFKVWEAARATSAAPPFFKPFTKEDTKTGYLDGALYHNCPVLVAHHERRTIWPDIADALPDVLLSIGTGINRAKDEYQSDLHSRETTRGGRHVVGRWERFLPVQMARITADRFDQILSCEATWSEFKARNLPQMPHQPSEYQSSEHETRDYRARESHRRHIRINPELQSAVPRLDAVDELVNLEVQTRQFLETPAQRMKIKEVANRLVASCRIHCRFSNLSNEMRYLGEYLYTCRNGTNFEPFFVVQEIGKPADAPLILPIDDMRSRGVFEMNGMYVGVSEKTSMTNIFLRFRSEAGPDPSYAMLPISGFPRELMSEENRRKN